MSGDNWWRVFNVCWPVVVLLVPWAFREFIQRGKLIIHPSGRVLQISFSGFGTGTLLMGTIQAHRRNQFVSKVDAVVHRKSDGSTKTLEWKFAYSGVHAPPDDQMANMDVPSGFMASTLGGKRFFYAMTDMEWEYKVLSPLKQNLSQRWAQVQINAFAVHMTSQDHLAPISEEERGKIREDAFKDLTGDASYTNLLAELERSCFWTADDYCMQVRVYRSNPDRMFAYCLNFSVSEEIANSLVGNSVPIIRGLCNLFVFPPYMGYVDYSKR